MSIRTTAFGLATLATLTACSSDPLKNSDSQSPLSFAASGTGTTVVVTEADITRQPENTPPTNQWVFYTRAAATGTFRNGPPTPPPPLPPRGTGSFEFVTPTGADKGTLFNYDYVNAPLSTANAWGYSTYRTAGAAPNQVTSINLEVDYNGPNVAGGFTTLVFEPVYNTTQGAIVDGVWQTWDAYQGGNAIWWSSKDIPGVCAFNCFVAWKDIVLANPDATILGGVGLNQGSGNPALTNAVDAFVVGIGGTTTTYNFELFVTASSKDQCKNGGWQNVKRGDGSAFKNQGDCVSYVQNGK